MLLLTQIVSWGSDDLIGEVAVSADSPFFEPGLGIPRWVGIEYMAQAVGALDGIRLREAAEPVPPGYLLGTRELRRLRGRAQDALGRRFGLPAFHRALLSAVAAPLHTLEHVVDAHIAESRAASCGGQT